MNRKIKEVSKLVDLPGNIVSLYQPTTRIGDRKDLLAYKNLLKKIENLPEKQWHIEDKKTFESLEEFLSNKEFWIYRTEGLAMFAKGNKYITFDLNQSVKESITVKKSPFLLPLIEASQEIEEHFVLDISRDRFQLWFSDGSKLTPIEADIAKSFDELFDDLDNDSNLNYGSYKGKISAYHGHRAKPEEVEKNKEKYFRYLDEQLSIYFEKHRIKVLLGGTSENIVDWRSRAKAPYYMDQDLGKPVGDFSDQELMNFTKNLFKTAFEKNLSDKLESLSQALENGRATRDLKVIKEKLIEENVGDLYVGSSYSAEQNDGVDELVAEALQKGANVIVIPDKYQEQKKLIAASFRF